VSPPPPLPQQQQQSPTPPPPPSPPPIPAAAAAAVVVVINFQNHINNSTVKIVNRYKCIYVYSIKFKTSVLNLTHSITNIYFYRGVAHMLTELTVQI